MVILSRYLSFLYCLRCGVHPQNKKLRVRHAHKKEEKIAQRNTYGGFVVGGEDVMDVSLDDGCLSCAEVADDEDLVQVLADFCWVGIFVHCLVCINVPRCCSCCYCRV